MQWTNLTPHEVTILGGGEPVVIPASGQVARVGQTLRETGAIWGVRTVASSYGAVVGLPEADDVCPLCGQTGCQHRSGAEPLCGGGEEPRRYIVSAMVRSAVPHRRDVFSPADFVRDSVGKIVGCQAMEGNA